MPAKALEVVFTGGLYILVAIDPGLIKPDLEAVVDTIEVDAGLRNCIR